MKGIDKLTKGAHHNQFKRFAHTKLMVGPGLEDEKLTP